MGKVYANPAVRLLPMSTSNGTSSQLYKSKHPVYFNIGLKQNLIKLHGPLSHTYNNNPRKTSNVGSIDVFRRILQHWIVEAGKQAVHEWQHTSKNKELRFAFMLWCNMQGCLIFRLCNICAVIYNLRSITAIKCIDHATIERIFKFPKDFVQCVSFGRSGATDAAFMWSKFWTDFELTVVASCRWKCKNSHTLKRNKQSTSKVF